MRFTQLVTKTIKEISHDEQSRNAQLLTRAGFIDKTMAGVYTLLPFGLRVLTNINRIIREEMDALGAHELLMPALQPRELWERTGRWDYLDVLYRVHSADGSHEFGLGPTHEEIVTPLVQKFVTSYRDLPRAVYQIQTKFRFEPRAKSGLLRGREFCMKDLYSFHDSPESLQEYYERASAAYDRVFARIGLKALRVHASGGTFSQFSDEFQVIAPTGEDTILHCSACDFAENVEIATIKAGDVCPDCGAPIQEKHSIEVGNIFSLNTKFTEPFGFTVTGSAGQQLPVYMGCYGIGCSRLLATVAEVLSDERGLVWPENIAPYRIHLIQLGADESVMAAAQDVYKQLQLKGVHVLFDDRADTTAGEKFADADLIGCPERIVVSAKTIAAASVEVKSRTSRDAQLLSIESFLDRSYV